MILYDLGAFKLHYLQSTIPIFAKWISTLLTTQMQNFPFPASREKGILQWTTKEDDTKTCMTFIQIGSFGVHKNQFWGNKFQLYYQATHSISLFYTEKGTPYSGPKSWCYQGVYSPGVFKLEHLESTQTYFWKINFNFINQSNTAFPFS